MSFQVVEILETYPEKIRVMVDHESHRLPAIIAANRAEDITIGKMIQAEINYDELLAWKVIDDFEDAKSAIWQEQDGIHLLGRIHNILDFGDGKTIIDVYMRNGPEFFTVSSETLDNTAIEGNSGLEITVGNLYLSER